MTLAVLMPLHNVEQTIERSLLSVLNQSTKKPFEVVCVLNNCTDDTERIVRQLATSHPRGKQVNLVWCSEPGIVSALNTGLLSIMGNKTYYTHVARQDGDDRWYPDKLELQMRFLETHQNIDVVGTQIQPVKPLTFDKLTDPHVVYPRTDEECKRWLVSSHNPIAHPSVLFKTSILIKTGIYDSLFPVAEDMWLWCKAALNGFKFANMDQVLVDYTISHNPNYNPLSPQLAANVLGVLTKHFGKRQP